MWFHLSRDLVFSMETIHSHRTPMVPALISNHFNLRIFVSKTLEKSLTGARVPGNIFLNVCTLEMEVER